LHEVSSLVDSGFFRDVKIMVLDGKIYKVPMPDPPHVMATTLVDYALRAAFGAARVCRVQQPLPLGLWSDPVPDIAVVAGSIRDFAEHPTTALIVVEVADSSLAIDTKEKAPLYAAGGILDYWIVDIKGRSLIVFRDPVADPASPSGFRYASEQKLDAAASVSPLAAPSAIVRVADLLP
jgi:Uma2 family endonuclease